MGGKREERREGKEGGKREERRESTGKKCIPSGIVTKEIFILLATANIDVRFGSHM